MVSRLPP